MVKDLNEIEPVDADYISIEGSLTEINCNVEFGGGVSLPHGIETSISGDINELSEVNLCFGEIDSDGNYTGGGFRVDLSVEDAKTLMDELKHLLERIEEENAYASDVA